MLSLTIDPVAVAMTFGFNVLCLVAGLIVSNATRKPYFRYPTVLVFFFVCVSFLASAAALILSGLGYAVWAGVLSFFGSSILGFSLFRWLRRI